MKVLQGSQDRSAGDCKQAKLPEVYTGVPTRVSVTTHVEIVL